MHPLQALEQDLSYFLGKDWNGASYEIRPEVAEYLTRLKAVEADNPYLLVAYIYHMYMGLLSGGQVRGKETSDLLSYFIRSATLVGIETCFL